MLSDDAAVVNGFSFQTATFRDRDSRTVRQPHSHTAGYPQSVMLIFSYSSIPQQLTPSGRLTD